MGRREGGVATYVRSTLQSTMWKPSADDKTFELQWTKVGIGVLYHPPKPQYKPESLLDYIESNVEEINQTFHDCMITLAGDFNQLSDREITERTGLTCIVYQPTRGANTLDRICVTSQIQRCTCRVISRQKRSPSGRGVF